METKTMTTWTDVFRLRRQLANHANLGRRIRVLEERAGIPTPPTGSLKQRLEALERRMNIQTDDAGKMVEGVNEPPRVD
jgi:hypothetical protein